MSSSQKSGARWSLKNGRFLAVHGSPGERGLRSKDYYELVPAAVRAPVKPALLDRFCMLFSSLPKLGTFVQGKAVDVTSSHVLLEGGKSVSYDHLVIASGSSYPEPSLKGGTSLQEKKRLLKVGPALSPLQHPAPCPPLPFLLVGGKFSRCAGSLMQASCGFLGLAPLGMLWDEDAVPFLRVKKTWCVRVSGGSRD